MPDGSPIGNIDGYVILGSSNARWPMRAGTEPVLETFDVTPQTAAALAGRKAGTPVTLTLETRGHKQVVKFLYVVNVLPGDNANIFRVTLADLRFWWTYKIINRRFNIRRNIGYKRLAATDVAELNPVAPNVWYAKYSLETKKRGRNSNNPVSPEEAMVDVMEGVLEPERILSGHKANVFFEQGIKFDGIPLEEVELQDPGNSAVGRALSYFPELDLYVNADGDIGIYSKVSGAEKLLIDALGPEMVGRGHVALVDNRFVRPREARVRFVREVELRFNFSEAALAVGQTTTELLDERVVENVMPVPDYILHSAEAPPEGWVQGTWITIDQAIRAYNALGGIPGIGRIDHDLLQRAFVPYFDLWTAMQISGVRDPDADWTARLAAFQEHYRRTYRIQMNWMDRILSIRDYRVATIDPVRGQRAPATAWADYCIVPSMRNLWKKLKDNEDLPYVINMKGYPNGGDNLGADSKPAPARVTVLDSDQGIVHLEYQIDPLRMVEQILPSMVTVNGHDGVDGDGRPTMPGPTADLRQRTRPISFDMVVDDNGWPKLTARHKVAIILTAVPASPNDERQFHTVTIKADDKRLEDMLPRSVAVGLKTALGPPMDIFIGPGQETARTAWVDSRSADIEKIFGITDGAPNLKGLVINDGETSDKRNGASLVTIALAAAARLYASMADRYQGAITGELLPLARPMGWANEIVHEITPDGVGQTHVALPDKLPQFNLLSYLDGSTRKILMRLAQQK